MLGAKDTPAGGPESDFPDMRYAASCRAEDHVRRPRPAATVTRVSALELLVEQLWGPGMGQGTRVEVDPTPDPDWRDAERYWALPDATQPRLLLPVAPTPVVRAAATHYRGLRRPPANVARQLLGATASAGLPLSRHQVVVQVRSAEDAAQLPLAGIADALGHTHLWATFGVRTGANRKATLQLLDDAARSVGYAKLGWNSTANAYVTTEARALGEVGGVDAAMRAPRLLASFTHGGRPVVVVEPLPDDVRGLRGAQQAPSSAELYALCPVERLARPGATAHLRAVGRRLETLHTEAGGDGPIAREVVDRARALLELLDRDRRTVPVQARWHGDLTPWNCARDATGQLWAWDWESCELDAVAGLDAVHWEFSVLREDRPVDRITLTDCLERARHHLTAAGHGRTTHGVVAAVHALTVVERAATLAAREGGWERVWITPVQLGRLLDEARTLLG